jgi:DNA polymerase-4
LENGRVRGIVVTASYEARELGIRTGTTLKEALKICPSLRVITPDYKLYHLFSYRLKLFLRKKIPLTEQYSIDEFFGDLEGWIREEDTESFIRGLKEEIKEKFSLPVSIGAAKSKWTAKLATSYAKPDGIKVIRDTGKFIKDIPVGKFPGIGRQIEKKLLEKGILTLGDVKREKEYFYSLGKNGIQLYKRVCGIDGEAVEENVIKKSIGISRRFDPVYDRKEIIRRVSILCRYLSFLVRKKNVNPTFYYLGIKYKHSKKSKAHIVQNRIFSEFLLKETMKSLFYRADIHRDYIISVGISVSKFKKVSNLFDLPEDIKMEKLNDAVYKLRSRYGLGALISASEII